MCSCVRKGDSLNVKLCQKGRGLHVKLCQKGQGSTCEVVSKRARVYM